MDNAVQVFTKKASQGKNPTTSHLANQAYQDDETIVLAERRPFENQLDHGGDALRQRLLLGLHLLPNKG